MASTAQQLIAYHRELVGGGLDHETIQALVKDAAQTIVMNDGLEVALVSSPLPAVPSKPLPPQA